MQETGGRTICSVVHSHHNDILTDSKVASIIDWLPAIPELQRTPKNPVHYGAAIGWRGR